MNQQDLFGIGRAVSESAPLQREILPRVHKLLEMYKAGLLGGEVMPEDSNPGLPLGSRENYLYFTLPMALNYQRDSYALWRSAKSCFLDEESRFVFFPDKVVNASEERLRDSLLKHKVALQPMRHVKTWRILCETLARSAESDVRNLIGSCGKSVANMSMLMQKRRREDYPCLKGPKIFNYWLYVLTQYTDLELEDRSAISVAPDTHVVKASIRLGVVGAGDLDGRETSLVVAEAWRSLLADSGLAPIDVHTPLWLWSRGGFRPIE